MTVFIQSKNANNNQFPQNIKKIYYKYLMKQEH
jgi:hypothetical protein